MLRFPNSFLSRGVPHGASHLKQLALLRLLTGASVILVSATNEILLLRRVRTSLSFPSAHVFPGGNLSPFHDQPFPSEADSASWHGDGIAYRLAAIRETFEESGLLLARQIDGSNDRPLSLPENVKEQGRRDVHDNRVAFTEWLASVNARPDVGPCPLFPILLAGIHEGRYPRSEEPFSLTCPRKPRSVHAMGNAPLSAEALHHTDVHLHVAPRRTLPGNLNFLCLFLFRRQYFADTTGSIFPTHNGWRTRGHRGHLRTSPSLAGKG